MSVAVGLSPVFNDQQFQDNNGVVLNGGQIFAYVAGSFVNEQTTYTDNTGATANSNPIVLDANGRLPSGIAIWLQTGLLYQLVLTASDGVTVLQYFDNVSGVPIPVTVAPDTVNIWNAEVDNPTYISSIEFSLPDNVTAHYVQNNRVRWTNSDSTFGYGTVINSVFTFPTTFITVQPDAAGLNSGITAIAWSSLIANGITVDAGGVSFASASTYAAPNTVGGQLVLDAAAIVAANLRIDGLYTTWLTSGSGANTPYAITPAPVIASYSVGEIFVVIFNDVSAGSPTLNVNGLGAKPLMMFASDSTLIPAVAAVGAVSQVAYDGTNFILLDQIPAVPFDVTDIPHGQTVFASNGTFTVPTGVSGIHITAVGAGGGGGGGDAGPGPDWQGGNGGIGGSGVGVISVTTGTMYTVTIGVGGSGGTFTGVNGTNGGSSTFGSTLVQGTGGAGGTGASGANGTNGANGHTGAGGYGAYGILYTIGSSIKAQGGIGALGATATGGAGSPGFVIVEW